MSVEPQQKKSHALLHKILDAAVKATPNVRAVVLVSVVHDPESGEDMVVFGGQHSSSGTQGQLVQLLHAAPQMLQDLVDRLGEASKPKGSA